MSTGKAQTFHTHNLQKKNHKKGKRPLKIKTNEYPLQTLRFYPVMRKTLRNKFTVIILA